METHTTKEGVEMLIAEMESDHLEKTIKTLCGKIEACRKILETPTGALKGNAVVMAINSEYSIEECEERAKDLIAFTHKKLLPYCLEATLRGIDIKESVQKAYGRSEGLPSRKSMALSLFFGRNLKGE